jgi:hypothetical protein
LKEKKRAHLATELLPFNSNAVRVAGRILRGGDGLIFAAIFLASLAIVYFFATLALVIVRLLVVPAPRSRRGHGRSHNKSQRCESYQKESGCIKFYRLLHLDILSKQKMGARVFIRYCLNQLWNGVDGCICVLLRRFGVIGTITSHI